MLQTINPKCPICGQGGLILVRLLDLDSRVCVLCSECEAIWEGRISTPLIPIIRFESYAEQHGIEADWHRIEELDSLPEVSPPASTPALDSHRQGR